jgi:hypothetical protein
VLDIIKFHIDNNYYVNIIPITKLIGCQAQFPANILLNVPETTITYLIEQDPLRIEIYENNIKPHNVVIPKYSARLLVLVDILMRTIARNLSPALILVEDAKEKTVFDTLDLELSTSDQDAEKKMLILLRNFLVSGEAENDIEETLLDGYRMMLDCFENGGL